LSRTILFLSNFQESENSKILQKERIHINFLEGNSPADLAHKTAAIPLTLLQVVLFLSLARILERGTTTTTASETAPALLAGKLYLSLYNLYPPLNSWFFL